MQGARDQPGPPHSAPRTRPALPLHLSHLKQQLTDLASSSNNSFKNSHQEQTVVARLVGIDHAKHYVPD